MTNNNPVPYPHPDGALAGYRVLELADEKGELGARLLGELGADVIKVEPPEGGPTRRIPPFFRGEASAENSLWWWALNAGKRSVTCDLDTDAGLARFRELVARSDVLIETATPGRMKALGLDYRSLSRLNPGLVMVSVTSFGQTGPYRLIEATDIVGSAMGGQMGLNGDDERGPLRTTAPQAYAQVSVQAAVGALIALYARGVNGGIGQHVDASMQEAMANTMDNAQPMWDILRINRPRPGNSRGNMRYVWACADGWIAAVRPLAGPTAGRVIDWFAETGEAGPLDSPEWRERLASMEPLSSEQRAIAEAIAAAFFRDRQKEDLVAEAQARNVGWAPVLTPRDLVESRHLAARDYWLTVDHGESDGQFIYPGAPFRLSLTPWKQRGRAPRPGEHDAEVARELRERAESASPAAPRRPRRLPKRPFEGIRVADFFWVGAGPLASKYLADQGAEVIRIESATSPDVLRRGQPQVDRPGLDSSGYYANFNSSKLGMSVNLKHPRGVELVKRLIAQCDVVTESFTAGTMTKLGLDYASLRKVRDDIVMISMPLYGQTGPWSGWMGFGHVLQGAAGINHLTGWPDAEPIGTGGPYTDFFAPHIAAIALVAALDYRRRTGHGQYIDLSQQEGAIHALGSAILDWTVNGHEQSRMGNRDPDAAPHGCYRSSDGVEVVIACFTEEHWQGLVGALGTPAWTQRECMRTKAGRLTEQDDLDSHLGRWCARRRSAGMVRLLRSRGVPCGIVHSPETLRADPQMRHRKHLWELEHPVMGRRTYDAPSFRLSRSPAEPRPAPLLGQHNEYIYRELLGLGEEEFTQLLVDGAFE